MLRFITSLFRSTRRTNAIINAQHAEIQRLANENLELRRRLFVKYSRCRIASITR